MNPPSLPKEAEARFLPARGRWGAEVADADEAAEVDCLRETEECRAGAVVEIEAVFIVLHPRVAGANQRRMTVTAGGKISAILICRLNKGR